MEGVYEDQGMGYFYDSSAQYTHYWTQDFGTRP